MKEGIILSAGVAGGILASFFGGWSTGMTTLMCLLIIDFTTGLVVAGLFKNSRKTKNGGLESVAGWKGIARKVMVLLLVGISYRLDLLLGVTYIRDAVIIAFVINEIISIFENAGLMGVPIPKPLQNALDVLRNNDTKKD